MVGVDIDSTNVTVSGRGERFSEWELVYSTSGNEDRNCGSSLVGFS